MRRNGRKWLAALMLVSLLSGCLPAGASAEKTLTWPSNVKVVGKEMFRDDTSIENVVLPEGVEGIDSLAFAGSSLKAIYLPSTLDMSQVAEDAFGGLQPIVRAPEGCEAYQWARDQGLLVEYRALVVGEKTFQTVEKVEDENTHQLVDKITINETAWRNVVDANRMETKLNSVSGYTGVEDHFTVRKEIDLTSEGIRSAIETTFAGTKPQDVSLFFIATHSTANGKLITLNDGDYLPVATLADWLTTYVQGRVIVILQTCYAGYAIYSPGIAENSISGSYAKNGSTDLTGEDRFTELAIQVFSKKDPGVPVRQEPDGSGRKKQKNSGEMRVENKFYVLAASRHNEESWGIEDGKTRSENFFYEVACGRHRDQKEIPGGYLAKGRSADPAGAFQLYFCSRRPLQNDHQGWDFLPACTMLSKIL